MLRAERFFQFGLKREQRRDCFFFLLQTRLTELNDHSVGLLFLFHMRGASKKKHWSEQVSVQLNILYTLI